MTIDLSMRWQVVHGDCIEVLQTLPPASIDSIVTDPPYGLGFMGKKWDTPGSLVERKADKSNKWDHVGGNHNPSSSFDSQRTRMREGRAFGRWCESWLVHSWHAAKPGAHLLAFGGTRTFHRLACAIEDAGWEIRDCLSYLYGSGFPKSLNLGCRCPRVQSARDYDSVRRVSVSVPGVPADATQSGEPDLLSQVQRSEAGSGVGEARAQGCDGTQSVEVAPVPAKGSEQPGMEGRRDAQASEGELPGRAVRASAGVGSADGTQGRVHHGASARDGDNSRAPTDAHGSRTSSESQPGGQPTGQPRTVRQQRRTQARRGDRCEDCGGLIGADGWGTALKPAWEPVIVARKPLVGTVAANHAAHGTGALNIDGCRIEGAKASGSDLPPLSFGGTNHRPFHDTAEPRDFDTSKGRWPANVALDEDAARALDEQSGEAGGGFGVRGAGGSTYGENRTFQGDGREVGYGDSGGASRFFYTAKASRSEREAGLSGPVAVNVDLTSGDRNRENERAGTNRNGPLRARNTHPTVKPVELMRWLVRLVTPVGGLVLDPFTGSGTTGVACHDEGLRFLGIEREAEYVAIARARIESAARQAVLPLAGGA